MNKLRFSESLIGGLISGLIGIFITVIMQERKKTIREYIGVMVRDAFVFDQTYFDYNTDVKEKFEEMVKPKLEELITLKIILISFYMQFKFKLIKHKEKNFGWLEYLIFLDKYINKIFKNVFLTINPQSDKLNNGIRIFRMYEDIIFVYRHHMILIPDGIFPIEYDGHDSYIEIIGNFFQYAINTYDLPEMSFIDGHSRLVNELQLNRLSRWEEYVQKYPSGIHRSITLEEIDDVLEM